ncbi:MAG: MBL fold metallo-hydrolase [Chloroflexi bacterium]|nr:MBL fold metallo-hydrolase [Chloroflexota bacterium]
MEIIWLGHSCFRIKGKQGTVITDPFAPEFGYKTGKLEADIVTVSHDHPGHNSTAAIAPVASNLAALPADGIFCSRPKVVHAPGEYDIANIWVTGIPSFHDSENGARRGKNCIYLIQIDDIVLCHLGDIGHRLSTQQLQDLGGAEVLFLPVGGHSTIDAAVASEIVRAVDPKLVIPMHYKTAAETSPLDTLDNFSKQMALAEVTAQARLSVTRNTLPDQTRVVVMDYAR